VPTSIVVTGLTVPLAVMVVTTSPRVTGAVAYWIGLAVLNFHTTPMATIAATARTAPVIQR